MKTKTIKLVGKIRLFNGFVLKITFLCMKNGHEFEITRIHGFGHFNCTFGHTFSERSNVCGLSIN